ncbi:unnamed protein product [Didymodactylos carnosus]|uniref:Protein kinase domain-containing protein n=2 Tax=Didymodactylos carnosus TaxID=1234261 RepID=A0A813ZSF3_9BILA|nr:unnamed protein product [Didymodactylos carnosus]CAF3684851.1 unnamed protein product [Didymodactylos carnosus]
MESERQRLRSLTNMINDTSISEMAVISSTILSHDSLTISSTVVPLNIPLSSSSISNNVEDDDVRLSKEESDNSIVPPHIYSIFGLYFTVGPDYYELKHLARGSYGHIVKAKHDLSNNKTIDVAIKRLDIKVPNLSVREKISYYKDIYQEIFIPSQLDEHENLMKIDDIIVPSQSFKHLKEIYLVQKLMDEDLCKVIKTRQTLNVKYIMYKIISGIRFIHSANVVHRDLTPNNILIKKDELFISDFGFATAGRIIFDDLEGDWCYPMSEEMNNQVGTRGYRAPELLLACPYYTKAVDMWSVGCIFGEMLSKCKIFHSYHDLPNLREIFELIGWPVSNEDLEWLPDHSRQYITKHFNNNPPQLRSFEELFPSSPPDDDALDLLTNLLKFNPYKRLTAEQAILHPYFQIYNNNNPTPTSNKLLWIELDHLNTVDDVKKFLFDEAINIRTRLHSQKSITGRKNEIEN